MRLAYLTSTYPKVSHTFIRRELRALEQRGHSILRVAIRPPATDLVDPVDVEEQCKTWHCLGNGWGRLMWGALAVAGTRPMAFARGVGSAASMGWGSDRGLVRHAAYLTEAASILRLLRRHDIEHVHVHFGHTPATVARLVYQLGGPSYSMTVHGIETFDGPRGISLPAKLNDAKFVVAISDFAGAQLRRWVGWQQWGKIHVVRCGIGDEYVRAAPWMDAGDQALVCVGRFASEKGHLVLLDAFARVARAVERARLVLVGDGELRRVIEERVRTLGLSKRVIITGFLAEAEVRQQMQGARALVVPSFAEGLPMVIAESFALGRPVIATCIAGIPELVRTGENGWLVTPGDTVELAGAMIAALRAPIEELRALGAAGRASVLEKHCLAEEAGKLEALFKRYMCTEPALMAQPVAASL